MGTYRISFKLRETKAASTERTIRVFVRWSGHAFRVSTGEMINPKDWNGEVKPYGLKPIKNTATHSERKRLKKIEARLIEIRDRIDDIFYNYEGGMPTLEEFKVLYDAQAKQAERQPVTLLEYIDEVMPYKEFNRQGVESTISPTSAGSYRQAGAHLRAYAEEKGQEVDFHNITEDFYKGFVKWMQAREVPGRKDGTKGYTSNTIGKVIKNIKSIMNHAVSDPGVPIKELPYDPKKFAPSKEDRMDHIYLTVEELLAMWDLEFTKDEGHLEIARDLFLMSAWTGLRFSDLARFNDFAQVDREKNKIWIDTKKTGQAVEIPLLDPPVPQILDKYEGKLPAMSNPKANKHIKTVAKRLEGFDQKMSFTRTEGGKKVTHWRHKHDMVMMHTARRSYATNLVYHLGVSHLSAMKMTGHTTIKTFENYIKLRREEAVSEIAQKFQLKMNGK